MYFLQQEVTWGEIELCAVHGGLMLSNAALRMEGGILKIHPREDI